MRLFSWEFSKICTTVILLLWTAASVINLYLHRYLLIFPIYFNLSHSKSYGCSLVYVITHHISGWPRADLRLVYQFWGHLIWVPKFKEGRKRETNVLHKNEKLPSVILFSRLSIKSKLHINTVNRTKIYHVTLIFSCFHQYFDKKVGTSCVELSTKQLDQLEFCP